MQKILNIFDKEQHAWYNGIKWLRGVVNIGYQDGDKNLNAKLTWDDVHYIRKHKWDYEVVDLAKKYGVDRRTITKVINHETWKEVIE